MDKITKVVPLDDFTFDIMTSSGVSGIFDVKPYMRGTAFRDLENPSYFKQVRPAHYGIMWPNGQDFSSDTIIWDITKTEHLQAVAESPTPYGTLDKSTTPEEIAIVEGDKS